MGLLFWKNKEKDLSAGAYGEKLAARYLKKRGYKILETNFQNPFGRRLGEIDIIAKKGGEIVFVEVKTRGLESYKDTLPEENITPAKLRKLDKIANFYIKTKGLWTLPYHFDAISVWVGAEREKAEIKHLENIFY
jgi:putative endonuclease